jgi:hypothetical protein
MAQCDDLGLHSSLAAKPDEKGIEQHYKVEHGRRMLTAQTCNFNSSKADEADGIFSKDRRPIALQRVLLNGVAEHMWWTDGVKEYPAATGFETRSFLLCGSNETLDQSYAGRCSGDGLVHWHDFATLDANAARSGPVLSKSCSPTSHSPRRPYRMKRHRVICFIPLLQGLVRENDYAWTDCGSTSDFG